MTIRFEPLTEEHLDRAVPLAHEAYHRACAHVPALIDPGAPVVLRRAVSQLARTGSGAVALEDDRLVGYLAFSDPIERLWNSGTGVHSPLHGNAFAGRQRSRLASRLFQHAAEPLVARGVEIFAITTYQHDHEVAAALSLNGFGMRCADAIRMVDHALEAEPVPGIAFREVRWEDAGPLLPLLNGLVRHLRQGPSFVGVTEFTQDDFAELRARRKSRYFVAAARDEPIGYLEVTDDGENVLTTAPDMRNICGAYLDERFRGKGIYDGLLAFTLATLREEGVARIGVDFETMNPTALHFWTRYFDRYTTSYARRIDALR